MCILASCSSSQNKTQMSHMCPESLKDLQLRSSCCYQCGMWWLSTVSAHWGNNDWQAQTAPWVPGRECKSNTHIWSHWKSLLTRIVNWRPPDANLSVWQCQKIATEYAQLILRIYLLTLIISILILQRGLRIRFLWYSLFLRSFLRKKRCYTFCLHSLFSLFYFTFPVS